ncbi:MAG: lipoyl(octanoyl) transferase LipB [Rickettsiales bacterium]|nr:lipoyl(octanoyl) transferase LipB [Rickettsiales bacterium]
MEWRIATEPVEYAVALREMQQRVAAVKNSEAEELVWLLEHPPVFTAGTSAKKEDLIQSEVATIPVFEVGRGGQYTYHGPGQRVGYFILDLKKRNPDIRVYVQQLEQIIIDSLSHFNLASFTREKRIGVWVDTPSGEAKIAAIGVRIQQGITSHGIAINRCPNLAHYKGIIPCGISNYGVSSLWELGIKISANELDEALISSISRSFS